MKLNLRDPLYILIIVCLVLFLLWQRSEGKRQQAERFQDNKIHQERVKDLENDKAISEATVKRLETARQRAADSAKVQQRARIQEIQGFKATIAKLKVKVQPQIDTNTDLSALISTYDLVIRKQSNLIDSLQLSHSAEVVNLTEQLKLKGEQLMIEQVKGNLWRETVEEREKEIRKLTRGKKFRNVVIGVLTAGIVYVSIRE